MISVHVVTLDLDRNEARSLHSHGYESWDEIEEWIRLRRRVWKRDGYRVEAVSFSTRRPASKVIVEVLRRRKP